MDLLIRSSQAYPFISLSGIQCQCPLWKKMSKKHIRFVRYIQDMNRISLQFLRAITNCWMKDIRRSGIIAVIEPEELVHRRSVPALLYMLQEQARKPRW